MQAGGLVRGGLGAGLLAAAALLAGCNLVGPIAYYLRPPQIQKPEFKLSESGRVAVLIESGRGVQESPVFAESLYNQIVEISRVKKSATEFVPLGDVYALRRSRPDFASLSVQRIGRELNAEQVLYIRIDELRTRESPDLPVVEPSVSVRCSVVGVHALPDMARLWPSEGEGRRETATRQAQMAAGPPDVDLALSKLAKDLAWRITVPFFQTDLETPLPVAR
jgi:hypothetical protein